MLAPNPALKVHCWVHLHPGCTYPTGVTPTKPSAVAGCTPRRPPPPVPSNPPFLLRVLCAAGLLDAGFLDGKLDENGTSYLEAARRAGYGAATTADMIRGARRTAQDLAYFVELHIEQVGGRGAGGGWVGLDGGGRAGLV